MRCGSCGWDNPAGIIFCTNCGKRLSERSQSGSTPLAAPPQVLAPAQATVAAGFADVKTDASACARCGAAAAPGIKFCRECGASLVSDRVTPEPLHTAVTPPATCWRCHQVRDVLASFCRHCGAPTTEPSAGGPALPTAKPPPGSDPGVNTQARLVTLLKDGSEGRAIALSDRDQDVGSREGDITFPDDPYLSSRHARILCRAGTYTLRDLDSVNGVYVRLREPVPLRDRDMVLVGQQVLRFELLSDGELPLGPAFQRGVLVFGTPEVARFARLVQYTTEGIGRDVHYLFRDETVIGRENGDIVFTEDPFLSRRHAAIRADRASGGFTLNDLGSSNGTAIRIRGDHVLRDGDQFRLGRHLFRFEAGVPGGRVGR